MFLIISDGKDGGREELKFLKVMGTQLLANKEVRHFYNLITKECLESWGQNYWRLKWSGTFPIKSRRNVWSWQIACYAQSRLWGESLTSTHQNRCRHTIYKIGKAQKHFIGESREAIRMGLSINL